MVTQNVLQKTKIFGELDEEALNELLKITEEKTFKEGEIVFPQGDESTELYILMQGEVEIQLKVAPQLAEITIYIVRPYDVFGEFAFVDPKPRSATARCSASCSIAMIKKKDFEALVDRFPYIGSHFYSSIAQKLAERLRRMNNYLRDIFLRSLGIEF